MTRRKVVQSVTAITYSIAQPWRPARMWWEYDLECGHTELRPVRYRGVPKSVNGAPYAMDQSPTPSLEVKCHTCEKAKREEAKR